MKKARVITAALVAAMITMGAGYAAWSDTVKVNSNVNTGNMNIEFIKTGIPAPMPYSFGLETGDSKYMQNTITSTEKEVTVSLNDLYPGAGLLYGTSFQNKGSIPVIIDSVEVIIDDTPFANNIKDDLIVVGGFIKAGSELDGGVFPNNLLDIILHGSDNYKLDDLQNNLNKMLKGQKLMPGDTISLDLPDEKSKEEVAQLLLREGIEGFDPSIHNCIIMGLPKSAENDLMSPDPNNPNSFTFKIKFNFKQFNK